MWLEQGGRGRRGRGWGFGGAGRWCRGLGEGCWAGFLFLKPTPPHPSAKGETGCRGREAVATVQTRTEVVGRRGWILGVLLMVKPAGLAIRALPLVASYLEKVLLSGEDSSRPSKSPQNRVWQSCPVRSDLLSSLPSLPGPAWGSRPVKPPGWRMQQTPCRVLSLSSPA